MCVYNTSTYTRPAQECIATARVNTHCSLCCNSAVSCMNGWGLLALCRYRLKSEAQIELTCMQILNTVFTLGKLVLTRILNFRDYPDGRVVCILILIWDHRSPKILLEPASSKTTSLYTVQGSHCRSHCTEFLNKLLLSITSIRSNGSVPCRWMHVSTYFP